MARYNLETTTDEQEAGVTFAREQYNAALPDELDVDGNVIDPNPNAITTNADYLSHIFGQWVASYCKQMKAADEAEYLAGDGKKALGDAITAKIAQRVA